MIPQIVAVIASGLFAGAAAYINLVQHPAADHLGAPHAVAFFAPMYARAAPLQASLAAIGALAAFRAWFVSSGPGWFVGGLILVLVIPFTLIVIKPTNDRLKDPSLNPGSDEAKRLLLHWWRLHAVRSAASVLSFVVFVISLAGA